MRAAILTTAFVIAGLALWANLRGAISRGSSAVAVAGAPAPALPDVAAAPARAPSAERAPDPIYEPASAAPASAQPPRDHVVVAGETLADIARRYYGDAARAEEIYAANRDRIRDPDQLHAGQTLVIP